MRNKNSDSYVRTTIAFILANITYNQTQCSSGAQKPMVEVRDLAATILELLHDEADKKGLHEISIAFVYKSLEKQAGYDLVQSAIKFLVDRDLIAPSSYTLTAKGRREHILKAREKP